MRKLRVIHRRQKGLTTCTCFDDRNTLRSTRFIDKIEKYLTILPHSVHDTINPNYLLSVSNFRSKEIFFALPLLSFLNILHELLSAPVKLQRIGLIFKKKINL